jgi:hypothetical protein
MSVWLRVWLRFAVMTAFDERASLSRTDAKVPLVSSLGDNSSAVRWAWIFIQHAALRAAAGMLPSRYEA